MAQPENRPVSTLRRETPRLGVSGGPAVVRMTGEYDPATVADLSGQFSAAIALDDADLVFDLSEVTFMDAATIGVIVRADAFLGAHARSLRLRDPSRCAQRILTICNLDALIEPGVEDHASTSSASALESWVAVPATVAGPNRFPQAPAGPSEVHDPDEVDSRPVLALVGTTPTECQSHAASSLPGRS